MLQHGLLSLAQTAQASLTMRATQHPGSMAYTGDREKVNGERLNGPLHMGWPHCQ